VRLVKICKLENSYEGLEHLTKSNEEVLKRLKLPYQKIVLFTSDMGFWQIRLMI